MNWYLRFLKFAAEGVQTMITPNPKGGWGFFTMVGNTAALNTEMKQKGIALGRGGLNFSYFRGAWSKRVDFVLKDNNRTVLEQFGVDCSPLDSPQAKAESSQWNKPTQPAPAPAATATPADPSQSQSPATQKLLQMKQELDDEMNAAGGGGKVKAMLNFIQKKLDHIAQMVDETSKNDFLRSFLSFAAKFHSYSLSNQFLIWAQKRDATYVRGHKQWLEMGRQVTNWKNGIHILAPAKKTKEVPDPKNPMQTKEESYMYFFGVTVYDISDTQPIPNWKSKDGKPPFEPQSWRQDSNDESEEMSLFVRAATKFAQDVGLRIDLEKALPPDYGGYSQVGGDIAVNKEFKGINQLSTLVHEITHALFHQMPDVLTNAEETKKLTSADKEAEAETTAFIVLSHYGWESKDTPTYLALHGLNSERMKARYNTIRSAVQFIIKGIDAAMSSTVEHAPEEPETTVAFFDIGQFIRLG